MANNYDRIIKENLDPLKLPLLKIVLGVEPQNLVTLPAKIQATHEIEMDSIWLWKHENPVHNLGLQIEFHVKDEDLRRRNFLHYALFYNAYEISLKQIVIYMGESEPNHITNNELNLYGLGSRFLVVQLNKIPFETFINSRKPEEILLAILANYGKNSPVEVVRMILKNLKKIVKRTTLLKKYQKQLVILSRLRKLEVLTKTEVENMPIHYEVETDGLYLEGIEKGIEQGIEKGIEQGIEKGLEEGLEKGVNLSIERMLMGAYSVQMIADVLKVPENRVKAILKKLTDEGKFN